MPDQVQARPDGDHQNNQEKHNLNLHVTTPSVSCSRRNRSKLALLTVSGQPLIFQSGSTLQVGRPVYGFLTACLLQTTPWHAWMGLLSSKP
jgi:hypothetical protein